MTKTESPKTETPKDPMFGLPLTPDAFAAFAREHLARMDTWMRELSALEGAMVARARATTQQLSQLTQDTIDYVAQLSAEWRKLAVDVTRRASDIVEPSGNWCDGEACASRAVGARRIPSATINPSRSTGTGTMVAPAVASSVRAATYPGSSTQAVSPVCVSTRAARCTPCCVPRTRMTCSAVAVTPRAAPTYAAMAARSGRWPAWVP